MGIIYTYKNVLLLVFVFLIEGELFKGYAAETSTMTSNGISNTETVTMLSTTIPPSTAIPLSDVESHETNGDIYVQWTPWNDTDTYYIIIWDEKSNVTSEINYTIREHEYDETSNETYILVCPAEDQENCDYTPEGTSQKIIHPVSNLKAEIKSDTLHVEWNDDHNNGGVRYNISWNDKTNFAVTTNKYWETNEFDRDSEVCVTAERDTESSREICEDAEENNDKDDPDIGLIVGLSVGVPVFVILIAAIVIIKWRPQLCGNGRSSGSRRNSMNMDPENNGRDNPQKSEEVLKSEFAMLKDINHKRSSDTAKKYKDKNHYVDVLPYDDTLVNLKKVDYVNASYILDKKFIVTPDPMPDQDNDIWQLIYECDIRVIIRISTEGDQKPMAQYIPDQKGDSWVMGADELQINLMDSQEWDGYTEKTLKLKKNESRDIKHFHLTNWPEGNVQKQQDQAKVLRLISSGRSFAKKNGNKPVLIHCGAGSGRTGTLAGIWHLMDQHDKNEMVNTVQCVKAMREDRVWMVQKEEQYFFMYNCISEYQSNSHIYRASEKEIGQYQ